MQSDQINLRPIYEQNETQNERDLSGSKRKERKGRNGSKKRSKQNMQWLVKNYSDSAKCYDLKLNGPNYNSNRNL